MDKVASVIHVVARPFRWNGDVLTSGEEFDTTKLTIVKLRRLFEKGHVVCMTYDEFDADDPQMPDFEHMSIPQLHRWLEMHGSVQKPQSRSRLIRKAHWMWERLLEGKCTYDAAGCRDDS